jgi:hypothetical protein
MPRASIQDWRNNATKTQGTGEDAEGARAGTCQYSQEVAGRRLYRRVWHGQRPCGLSPDRDYGQRQPVHEVIIQLDSINSVKRHKFIKYELIVKFELIFAE